MKKYFFLILMGFIAISCTTTEEIKEIVVIGGGLMGSSTAWQLSKYGEKVLLLEQQDSVYTHGSSFGEARIARSSNRGNDMWSYLHNRSVKEVQDLISFLNATSEKETYQMEDIYTTSPVTYVGRIGIYDRLLSSLIRQKVDYKMAINPLEGKTMFDVNLPDSVLIQKEYNLHSGTINPKKLIGHLHRAVREKGNEIWYKHQVERITQKEGYYEIEIRDLAKAELRLIKTRKVISAAGPYTGTLLKDIAPYFDQLINPQRVFLAFLKIDKAIYDSWSEEQKMKLASAYPVINSSKGTRDGSFFSMIEKIDEDGVPVIKIGGHFQRSDIGNLDEVWKKELTPKEIDWSKSGTLRYFDLLNLPLKSDQLIYTDGYSCVYTLTQTEVPYVSNLISGEQEANPNFIALGGMSGVGAKGAMTYGLIAAHTLLNKEESDEMYMKVRKALGFERLLSDVAAMR